MPASGNINWWLSLSMSDSVTLNAGDVLKMQYRVASGTGLFQQRSFWLQPVRVS